MTESDTDRLLAEALLQAAKVANPFAKGLLMADLADKYALTDRRREARQALGQALLLARKVTDEEERVEMLLEVADHFIRHQRRDSGRRMLAKALTAAEGIDDYLFRSAALNKIAEKYGAADDRKQGLETLCHALASARKITDPASAVTALAKIAANYAKLDQPAPAAAIFAESLNLVANMAHFPVTERVDAICCIAEYQARSGACAAALAIFKSAPQENQATSLHESQRLAYTREYCLRVIAEQYAANGFLTDALAMAVCIPTGYHKVLALSRITGQYIADGQTARACLILDETLATARQEIKNDYFRARSLATLANQYLAADKPASGLPLLADAITIARRISPSGFGPYLQECALGEIAAIYAEAGRLPQAQITAAAVTNPADKAKTLAAMALGDHRFRLAFGRAKRVQA